jgi:hypothetical protein
MSPDPKSKREYHSALNSPLGKASSMFEILAENRVNSKQVQSSMYNSQKKAIFPPLSDTLINLPSTCDHEYKAKVKEERFKKRVFIELES